MTPELSCKGRGRVSGWQGRVWRYAGEERAGARTAELCVELCGAASHGRGCTGDCELHPAGRARRRSAFHMELSGSV